MPAMLKANIAARTAFFAARQLERVAARLRGKGFGSYSIKQEVALALRALGKPPTLIIDAGGNVGHYTACVRTLAPGCEVVVFEPCASNIAHLQTRFSRDDAITIVNKGLSDGAGAATLYADHEGSGAASLSNRRLTHFGVDFAYEETVHLIDFDSFWMDQLESRPIDIMKLDIEGHELQALTGASSALQHTSVVQFEFGGCNIDSRTFFQDFYYFFDEAGFNITRVTPFGPEPITGYAEEDETFVTTNFLAVRRGN